jgi:hypothetical protein
VNLDMAEAKDNLMLAKVFQADEASRRRSPEDVYVIENMAMLSTSNSRKDYTSP